MKPTKLCIMMLLTASVFFLFSCKKDTPDMAAPSALTSPGTLTADNIKDSSAAIARDIYLWNNQIPASFNARSYADPSKIMEAIHPYSVENGFSQPVDRWSFAMKKTEWDAYSGGMSTLATGTSANGDLGMTVFFRAEGDLRVRHAEPYSPAGLAGVRRGWRILSINGSTAITTANSTSIVNNLYYSASATVQFQKPDGSNVTLNLAAGHYSDKPVYLDTVYNIGGKKIGYLVFNSFLGNVNQLNNDLQRAFNDFSSQSVTDLVVDLRYNGGGYVSIQETLANYIINNSANGSVMMKQIYNSQNAQNNTTTVFHKLGNVNLAKVYFITTSSTASASELLINNLKPYLDVRLVGTKTHGKPVGFFPIPVADWYVFPVSFRTTNKNGDGNYFNGIAVNSTVGDGLDKDWGDLNETSLASAIRNITNGSYRGQEETPFVADPVVNSGNNIWKNLSSK